jgi:hypothetical protein
MTLLATQKAMTTRSPLWDGADALPSTAPIALKVRAIACDLPQFHASAENGVPIARRVIALATTPIACRP